MMILMKMKLMIMSKEETNVMRENISNTKEEIELWREEEKWKPEGVKKYWWKWHWSQWPILSISETK